VVCGGGVVVVVVLVVVLLLNHSSSSCSTKGGGEGVTQHKWPAGRKFMWSQSAPLWAQLQLHTTTTTAGGNHPEKIK
jgi:hypothetical protein